MIINNISKLKVKGESKNIRPDDLAFTFQCSVQKHNFVQFSRRRKHEKIFKLGSNSMKELYLEVESQSNKIQQRKLHLISFKYQNIIALLL